MQKQKHWNAKYQCKPQLWSLHRDVSKARHCRVAFLISVSEASHYQWGSCSLRMTGTAFALLLVIYTMKSQGWSQENPQGNVSHTRQNRARKKRGRVRRKTIWGKNLSAAQLEATEKKGHQGTAPKSQSQEHPLWLPDRGSHPRKHDRMNSQERSRLLSSSCPNFKCHL